MSNGSERLSVPPSEKYRLRTRTVQSKTETSRDRIVQSKLENGRGPSVQSKTETGRDRTVRSKVDTGRSRKSESRIGENQLPAVEVKTLSRRDKFVKFFDLFVHLFQVRLVFLSFLLSFFLSFYKLKKMFLLFPVDLLFNNLHCHHPPHRKHGAELTERKFTSKTKLNNTVGAPPWDLGQWYQSVIRMKFIQIY